MYLIPTDSKTTKYQTCKKNKNQQQKSEHDIY
jgi:hypothetical protein